MNCNTHGDTAAVAFCRTCGKPLCNQCTRDVRGVIYCEACLAARMEGMAPAAGFVPPQQTVYPPYTPPYTLAGRPRTSPSQFRAKSRGGRNPRWILPYRCRRSLHRPVCQGIVAPGHHGAVDPRREFRSAVARDHRSGDRDRILLRLPDHRRQFAARRPSRWANLLPTLSVWRRFLVLERSLKGRRFPPAPRF